MRRRTGKSPAKPINRVKPNPKRPTDVNRLADFVGEEPTGNKVRDSRTPPNVSQVMKLMGQKGGKIGGKRRAEKMTDEQRRASASKAARARWGKV